FLSGWTAVPEGVSRSCGIPQGPLGSGLLAEVLLKRFDERFPMHRARYQRYVDDIRLFGDSAGKLEECVSILEEICAEIGVHANAAKVHIHEIENISEEMKAVSRHEDQWLDGRRINQRRLRQQIIALTPRLKVKDDTGFKYALGSAEPHWRIASRVT